MSLGSTNILSDKATISKVKKLIEMLGYTKYQDYSGYFWYDKNNYKSYVGVELEINCENKTIEIHTRTRAGRSYWDLKQQNKTIKYFKDYFGGSFETDEGKGRYYSLDDKPPTELESGLFISRWVYNNALMQPRIYLSTRKIEANVARPEPTGWDFIDIMNPILFSNNLLIPYFVGIWEEYLKSSYIVLLKFSVNRERILKNARLTSDNLQDISSGIVSVEEAIADGLSFQRPKIIAENFKSLDNRIDIYSTLKKPYI